MSSPYVSSWKLVRDGCREKIPGRFRRAPDPAAALRRKLLEEVGEYIEHLDPAELYDIYDVLDALTGLADPDGSAERRHEVMKVQVWGLFSELLEWNPAVPGEPGYVSEEKA